MPASPGLRFALGAALAGAAASAHADWQCTDAFGNAYRFERPPSSGSDLECVDDTPPPEDPATAPRKRVPIAPIGPVFVPATLSMDITRHGGALVLAPGMRGGGGSPTVPTAERRAAFDPMIEAIARSTDQDADLLRAIVQVESRFDPGAVSSKGAIGLMQVMPATAAEFGLAEPKRTLFEPESNLRVGAMYLRRLLDMFPGNPQLAIAAYNAGEGAVQHYGFTVPPYPETQGYVRDVLAIWAELRSQH